MSFYKDFITKYGNNIARIIKAFEQQKEEPANGITRKIPKTYNRPQFTQNQYRTIFVSTKAPSIYSLLKHIKTYHRMAEHSKSVAFYRASTNLHLKNTKKN